MGEAPGAAWAGSNRSVFSFFSNFLDWSLAAARESHTALPTHRYAMTLKRRNPGDPQAPTAEPEADWSRQPTSCWLSHVPPPLLADRWFGSEAVDEKTTATLGTPRPTLLALPRKPVRAGIQVDCTRSCATPPTGASQYQCALSGIDYMDRLRELDAPCVD